MCPRPAPADVNGGIIPLCWKQAAHGAVAQSTRSGGMPRATRSGGMPQATQRSPLSRPSRKLGCAMAVSASALCRMVLPLSEATPYSVTT